jgi:hypothetical protein
VFKSKRWRIGNPLCHDAFKTFSPQLCHCGIKQNKVRTNEEILNEIVNSKDFSVLSSNKEGFLEECKSYLKPSGSTITSYFVDIDDGWNVRVAFSYKDRDIWCVRFFTIGKNWNASVDVNGASKEQVEKFINAKQQA